MGQTTCSRGAKSSAARPPVVLSGPRFLPTHGAYSTGRPDTVRGRKGKMPPQWGGDVGGSDGFARGPCALREMWLCVLLSLVDQGSGASCVWMQGREGCATAWLSEAAEEQDKSRDPPHPPWRPTGRPATLLLGVVTKELHGRARKHSLPGVDASAWPVSEPLGGGSEPARGQTSM